MPKRSLLARLTGWPMITTKYRAHWRVMIYAHPLILKLLEDNADGDTRRASLTEWHRAERPVADVLRGTTSLFRIDGPRQIVGREAFAMGALIESPGVTAHLDPVETLHLEGRVRTAIEQEILRWIAEQGLQDRPPVPPHVDRDFADPKAMRRMWHEGKCTLEDLLTALQSRTKDDLKVWLGNSSSARTFAEDADRATGSVLFMLAKAANLIQFLRIEGGGNPFAFRDFIHGLDKRSGPRPWIFVPRKEDYFEASKPLLACWLECAASAVLGLPPSPDRRIWFILDELADLPRVENMARLLPEGRKFGAAVILTFQALGQMRHRYGPQIAESMLGCCNTKLFLQTIDSETRLWASQTIGDCEVEIHTMTDALASGDEAPRTTLSKSRKVRPAILESELRLPKYEGFLLFPDGLPVARITMTAGHLQSRGAAKHLGFIAGDMKATLWKQLANSPPPAPSPLAQSGDGPV